MRSEAIEGLEGVRDLLERGRKAAPKRKAASKRSAKARKGEGLPDIVERIQVFAQTQGRVVGSYAGRLQAAVKEAGLEGEAQEKMGKLIGVMDQLQAAMRELEPAAKAVRL